MGHNEHIDELNRKIDYSADEFEKGMGGELCI